MAIREVLSAALLAAVVSSAAVDFHDKLPDLNLEFIYHEPKSLLLTVHNDTCYFSFTHTHIRETLEDHKQRVEDFIVAKIKEVESTTGHVHHVHVTDISHVRDHFQDLSADYRCADKTLYTIDFDYGDLPRETTTKPSASATRGPTVVAPTAHPDHPDYPDHPDHPPHPPHPPQSHEHIPHSQELLHPPHSQELLNHPPGPHSQELLNHPPGSNSQELLNHPPGPHSQELLNHPPGPHSQELLHHPPPSQELIDQLPLEPDQSPQRQGNPDHQPPIPLNLLDPNSNELFGEVSGETESVEE